MCCLQILVWLFQNGVIKDTEVGGEATFLEVC